MAKRKRTLSYANVTATLALVVSMSSGALAANHYLINSASQINPKVLKTLKGNSGAPGPQGPAGQAGKEGTAGKDGVAGKEGVPGREGTAGKEGLPGKEGKEGKQGPEGKEGREGKVSTKSLTICVSQKAGKPITAPPCKKNFQEIEVAEL